MSVNLPDRALRLGLAATLTLSGIKLAGVPRAEAVIIVALATAAVVLLVAAVRRLVRGFARPQPAAAEAGATPGPGAR